MTKRSSVLPWFAVLGVLASCGGIIQPLGDIEGKGGVGGLVNESGSSAAGTTNVSGGASGNSVMPQGGKSLLPEISDPYAQESCYSVCAEEILRDPTGCKLCHGTALAASGLNLESLGRIARLKDVPAKHADLPMGQAADCPTGDKLIDSVNVNQSWLLKKIRGQQGDCGTQDPPTGALNQPDMACLTSYIECIAGLDEVR